MLRRYIAPVPLNSLAKHGTSLESTPARSLSAPLQAFLEHIARPRPTRAPDEPVIHVSSVLSGAASFYERLRYSIDYREAHLLRRHAFERILRRRLEITGAREELGKLFLVELVQAGYLKNDDVPEAIIPRVDRVLARYDAVLEDVENAPVRDKDGLKDWFLGLASAELEELLVPSPEDEAMVNLMTTVIEHDRPLAAWKLDEDLEATLIYIAAYRALFAFDPPTLHFLLLTRRLPSWGEDGAARVPLATLLKHHQAIARALQHPAGERLWRALKSRAIVFHGLSDVVKNAGDDPSALLSSPDRLRAEFEAVCKGYYQGARRRLYGSAGRAVIYVLLTKMIIAIGIEAPIERFLLGGVHEVPLMINLLFPPVLLAVVALVTRIPGETNTKQALGFLESIVWGGDRRVFPEVRRVRRSAAAATGLGAVYGFTFFLTFGLIAYGLLQIQFTFISITLFLFFLSVVSFFALRIRQPVRDLYVVRPRDNVFTLLIDFFSLPILRVGRWISTTSARFNVFLFFFDYFLEAPIKAVLLVSEDVLGFFREKRDDIV